MTTHCSASATVDNGSRPCCLAIVAALVAILCTTNVSAQAPAAPGGVAYAPSATELDNLVSRIALYPDDLVAIILPAATNPLQVVQAESYLAKRKIDPKLALNEKWDDSVKSLLNYPDIVKTMSADIEWTAALGEAVVADQGAVLEAIQAFRRKTQAAGNLKSDAKQVIAVEKEIITIVPADPEVIYVPQYDPSTVVVAGGNPSWGYYPSPYPVYHYPYAPGAALATGLIWGAAIGAAWTGGHYHAHYGRGEANINVNRNVNVNTGDVNLNRGRTASQRPAGGTSQWKPNRQPGQVSGSVSRTSATRAGYAAADRGSRPAAAGRSSTQRAGGGSVVRTGTSGANAFGGYGSGRQTQMDSSRGAASRASMSGAGTRPAASPAGARQMPSSGVRAGGGGGGARIGGGGGGSRGGRR